MDTLMQADIFFFISGVGFVILGALFTIFLAYLIIGMRSLSRILKRAEDDIESIGDTTKEMIEDIRESRIFSFIFGKKRRR